MHTDPIGNWSKQVVTSSSTSIYIGAIGSQWIFLPIDDVIWWSLGVWVAIDTPVIRIRIVSQHPVPPTYKFSCGVPSFWIVRAPLQQLHFD